MITRSCFNLFCLSPLMYRLRLKSGMQRRTNIHKISNLETCITNKHTTQFYSRNFLILHHIGHASPVVRTHALQIATELYSNEIQLSNLVKSKKQKSNSNLKCSGAKQDPGATIPSEGQPNVANLGAVWRPTPSAPKNFSRHCPILQHNGQELMGKHLRPGPPENLNLH